MANWNGLQLTNKGIALQAKVQAGTELEITKLKLGSGVVPSGTDIKTLTDLITPEQNLGIGGTEAVGDYCKVSATISNSGLEAGYYVRELGVLRRIQTKVKYFICTPLMARLTICLPVAAVQ